MPDRARVTSLEVVESFRAKLIIYREKAGRVLDEATEEVTRTRLWLETDRRTHWQNEWERRDRRLRERQQELFSAQLSGLRESSQAQQFAVQKAKQAVREVEAKLQLVKQWKRQYDQRVQPLAQHAEKLRHTLTHDLALALAYLAEVIRTLSAYADLSPAEPAPLATAPGTDSTETQSTDGGRQP